MSTTDEAIHAELNAIAGEFIPAGDGPQPGAGPQAETPPPQADWKMAAQGAVFMFDKVIAPNWDLDSEEKDALAAGTEMVLTAFMPTMTIDPRVQAVFAFGAIFMGIAGRRMDEKGKMKPMRKPREPKPEDSGEPAHHPV